MLSSGIWTDISEEHIISIVSVMKLWVFPAYSEDMRHKGQQAGKIQESQYPEDVGDVPLKK
jgi:hypothetical protein